MNQTKEQSVTDIINTIDNYSVDVIHAIVSKSMTASDSIAGMADILTMGAYDNKQTIPALKRKFKEYCLREQLPIVDYIDTFKSESYKDIISALVKESTARIGHLQKAINRALVAAARKRALTNDSTLVLKHSKLANDKRHLFASKKITVQVKPPVEVEEKTPDTSGAVEPTESISGAGSIAQQVGDEQQAAEIKRGELLATFSDIISEAVAMGDTQLLSTIATQCLSGLETIQKAKPTEQTASSKRGFTTALKLMSTYRSHVTH